MKTESEKNMKDIIEALNGLIIALRDFNIEFEYQSNRVCKLLEKENKEDANG